MAVYGARPNEKKLSYRNGEANSANYFAESF
jgi:hypothetical protein